jgi:hypothetical protein
MSDQYEGGNEQVPGSGQDNPLPVPQNPPSDQVAQLITGFVTDSMPEALRQHNENKSD